MVAGGKFLLAAASLVVIIAGLREAQPIIIPTLISVFLAILCAPVVQFLQRKKFPTVLAVLLVVAVVMGVMAGVGAILGGSVNSFTEEAPKYQDRMNLLLGSLRIWLIGLGAPARTLELGNLADPGAMITVIGRALSGLAAALSNTVLVLLTLVFILLEVTGFSAKLRAIAGGADPDLDRYERVTAQVQQYLLIKTITSLTTGILVGLWLLFLGVDFPLLWGLLAFLLNYVPNLGSIIAAIPPVLLALIQLGVGYSAAAAAGFLVVNVAIGSMIEPHLLGRRLGLSTLVVFLSLVFWGWVWGPIGMLLSVPLTMIIKIFLENSPELGWVAVLLDSPGSVAASLSPSEIHGDTEPEGDTAPRAPPEG